MTSGAKGIVQAAERQLEALEKANMLVPRVTTATEEALAALRCVGDTRNPSVLTISFRAQLLDGRSAVSLCLPVLYLLLEDPISAVAVYPHFQLTSPFGISHLLDNSRALSF